MFRKYVEFKMWNMCCFYATWFFFMLLQVQKIWQNWMWKSNVNIFFVQACPKNMGKIRNVKICVSCSENMCQNMTDFIMKLVTYFEHDQFLYQNSNVSHDFRAYNRTHNVFWSRMCGFYGFTCENYVTKVIKIAPVLDKKQHQPHVLHKKQHFFHTVKKVKQQHFHTKIEHLPKNLYRFHTGFYTLSHIIKMNPMCKWNTYSALHPLAIHMMSDLLQMNLSNLNCYPRALI